MPEVESRAVRHDESFYRAVLAELPASGLTLKSFALSKGIKPATLYAWSRRLRAESDPDRVPVAPEVVAEPPFLRPVRVVAAATTARSNGSMPIEIIVRGDVEIRVPSDLGIEPLVRLVSTLRG